MVFYMFFMCFNAVGYEGRKKTSYNIHTYRYVHKKREENDSWDEGIQKMKLIGMRNAFSFFFFRSSSFFFSFLTKKKLYRAEKRKTKEEKKLKEKRVGLESKKIKKMMETMERGFLRIKSRKCETFAWTH